MNLVNQLQASAESDDVLQVLRRAKRLCSKLKRVDLKQWLQWETDGYPTDAKLPEYRCIASTLAYNTNGFIPAGMGRVTRGIYPMPPGFPTPDFPLRTSIGEIAVTIAAARGKSGKLYFTLGEQDCDRLRSQLHVSDLPEILDRFTFVIQPDMMAIENVPERVKDVVLDWACDLETAGVLGENHSFTTTEVKTAAGIVPQAVSVVVNGDVHGGIQAASPGASQAVRGSGRRGSTRGR